MRNKKLEFAFKAKKEGNNTDVVIEGFANRAAIKGEKVVDRGNEHIPKEEWKIDEWLKNPIIFLNHDRDIPIGKGLDAKVTDDGLWIKVQISKSEAPAIKMARDLIEEGILKTFSVGIDVEEEEVAEDKSITLKGVNLLETSVVSIPMNQESFFSISKKCLEEKPLDILESEILRSEGKVLAAKIHEKLYSFCDGTKTKREDVLENLKNYSSDFEKLLKGDFVEDVEDLFEVLKTNLDFEEGELEKALEEEEEISEEEGEEEEKAEDEEEMEDEELGEEEEEKQIPHDLGEETDQLKTDLGQPALQAMQQMTVLLGQLISETQKTHKLLEGIVTPKMEEEVEDEEELEFLPEEEEEEKAEEEVEDDEELKEDPEDEELEEDEDEEKSLEFSKALDIIGSYSEKLNKSLSRFNL